MRSMFAMGVFGAHTSSTTYALVNIDTEDPTPQMEPLTEASVVGSGVALLALGESTYLGR